MFLSFALSGTLKTCLAFATHLTPHKYMKTCLHVVVSKFNADFWETRENVEPWLLEQSVNVFGYLLRQLDIHQM